MIKNSERLFDLHTMQITKSNLAKLKNSELLSLFKHSLKLYQNFFNKAIWVPFSIEPLLAEETEREIVKFVKKIKAKVGYQEYFGIIFSPEKKNAIARERVSMLKIAIKIRKGKSVDADLKKHWKNFQWIPTYDPGDVSWGVDYFKEQLERVIAPKEELNKFLVDFKNRGKKFRNLMTMRALSTRQRDLFHMAHAMCFIKDERDDYRRKCSFQIQQLYAEIGRRAGLNLKEAVNMLSLETENFLNIGKFDNFEKMKERAHGYVLLRKHGAEIKIFSGKEASKIKEKELNNPSKSNEQEIRGVVGSCGKAQGEVQLVITKHDLRKIKKGDVMVAVTTHPDFVPAMRLASAIVTDEGGLTCHAAIVSRELNIPCIAGTKVATKFLKDGDIVEVDANKGIIKKL